MLWNTSCLRRLSVMYRGRAVPLVWQVIEHGSAAVSFATDKDVLEQAKTRLPFACEVVFLADRGFADADLFAVGTDKPHLVDADPVVDPGLGADGASLTLSVTPGTKKASAPMHAEAC